MENLSNVFKKFAPGPVEAKRVAELQSGVVKPKAVKERIGGARTSKDITPKKPVSRANLFGSAQISPGLKKKLGA